MVREIRIHRQAGRESTECGRGASRPAFITQDPARVTCPRCLRIQQNRLARNAAALVRQMTKGVR